LFMSLANEIAADLAAIEPDMGNTCTIAGESMACIANFLRRGQTIVFGGKETTIKLTVLVRASLMATVPALKETITYSGTKYRIVERRFAPTETHYEFDLIDLSER
jgi:hypothetical protein